MSNISAQIINNLPDKIDTIKITRAADLHGQRAIEVMANLVNGQSVTGTFTTESKPGFGGVEFESKKDIAALMTAKIESVLKGTAE